MIYANEEDKQYHGRLKVEDKQCTVLVEDEQCTEAAACRR
jgi:hypothetical protein